MEASLVHAGSIRQQVMDALRLHMMCATVQVKSMLLPACCRAQDRIAPCPCSSSSTTSELQGEQLMSR